MKEGKTANTYDPEQAKEKAIRIGKKDRDGCSYDPGTEEYDDYMRGLERGYERGYRNQK